MAVLKFDKRLKRVLTKRGVVAEDKIGEAFSKAEFSDKSLTEVLLEDKLVTEEALLDALSQETNLPPINAFKIQSDDYLAELFPQNLAS